MFTEKVVGPESSGSRASTTREGADGDPLHSPAIIPGTDIIDRMSNITALLDRWAMSAVEAISPENVSRALLQRRNDVVR